jgi:hypothetical protein
MPDHFRATHEADLGKKIREPLSTYVVAILVRVQRRGFESSDDTVEQGLTRTLLDY